MTGSIPQEFIREIIDLSDVVEIVEEKKRERPLGAVPFL